jgi:alpha-aminoadipate carrier protein LysW
MITCPACGADIDIEEDDLDEGDLFDCTECGANLKVASLKPLELIALKDNGSFDEDDEDEDYDDEDDDEDEDEEEDDDGYEDELEEEEDEEDDWN